MIVKNEVLSALPAALHPHLETVTWGSGGHNQRLNIMLAKFTYVLFLHKNGNIFPGLSSQPAVIFLHTYQDAHSFNNKC